LQLLTASQNASSHRGEISACAFSPDNRYVLSGGWDGHLRLWDAGSGLVVTDLKVGTKPVSACAISPEGDQWLAGSLDGILSRWEPMSHRQISTFLAHTRPVSAIVFGSDGRTLVTASWDCQLIMWSRTNERDGRTLSGHKDIVAGCCFSPNGRTLMSWSHDGTVRLWEVLRGRLSQTFSGHTDRVVSAAFSPDGSWAISGSRDGVLKLWDLQAECEAGSLQLDHEINSCFFLLHGGAFCSVQANGRLRLYSVPEMALETELDSGLPIQCATLSPTGEQIALGCGDGRIHFAAVEGGDNVPLVVTATQTSKRTATALQRLFGKSRITHSYICTCPICRNSFELPNHDPDKPVTCPHCSRQLRVQGIVPMVQEITSPVSR
jgi:WD40 repeat protein